jgi:hypothetical protein
MPPNAFGEQEYAWYRKNRRCWSGSDGVGDCSGSCADRFEGQGRPELPVNLLELTGFVVRPISTNHFPAMLMKRVRRENRPGHG